jgi:hypothetical protein
MMMTTIKRSQNQSEFLFHPKNTIPYMKMMKIFKESHSTLVRVPEKEANAHKHTEIE